MTFLTLVILMFASFRITRFIVDDSLTDWFRNKLIDWHSKTHSRISHFFLDLFTCPWCLGFWISGLATLAFALTTDVWPNQDDVWAEVIVFGLVWWAVAGGAAVISTTVKKLEGIES